MPSCCASLFPGAITAGLDFQVRIALPDYPAPTWALQAFLRGQHAIDLTATADDAAHIFAADAEATAAWNPGTYWYSVRASNGSSVVEVEKGSLTIERDLAAITGPYDGRSKWEIGLEAIDAVLARRATQDQMRYTIDKRELWRTPIADLLKLRSYYAAKVRAERARACGRGGIGRNIPVRFTA